MIPLEAVVALTGALLPHDAARVLSHLAGPLAAHAASEATALAQRSRTDRAAALARAVQEAARGSSRVARGPLVDRLWRDSASWSRARAAAPGTSAPAHALPRGARDFARHAT